ncbi:hypothetical protein FLTE109939_13315 [Flavobacterium terrigena]
MICVAEVAVNENQVSSSVVPPHVEVGKPEFVAPVIVPAVATVQAISAFTGTVNGVAQLSFVGLV